MGLGVLGVPPEVIALGVITGLAYGLAGVALVMIFRATKVLNLALAQTGAVGALVLAELHRAGFGYWPALAGGLIAGALLAAATQLLIVERLRSVPPLVTLLATLGVARALVSFVDWVGNPIAPGVPFPGPTVLPAFNLGALRVTEARTGLLVLAPLVLIALGLGMTRTAFGRGLLAAGDDRDAALGLGVHVRRSTVLLCAAAGALTTITAVFTLPSGGVPTAEALGPALLMRALAAAAIGGFSRPWAALAGGVGVGVIEQVVIDRANEVGLVPPILLVIVIAALALGPRPTGRRTPRGAWVLVAARNGGGRLAWAAAAAVLLAAAVLVADLGTADLLTLNRVLGVSIVAVSAWLVTSLTGQVSFGQMAVAGLGAAGGAGIALATGNEVLGLIAGLIVGAVTGGILAIAGRTNRDLGPAVLTLTFAVVATGPLLRQSWALGSGRAPAQPFHDLRGAAAVALLGLIAAVAVSSLLARSSFGRSLVAARDNEPAAVGLGVAATRTRIQALAIAGAIAGLGGVLLAQPLGVVSADEFPVTAGFDVVAAAVVGGLASPAGAILGAALVLGVPAIIGAGPGGLVASSVLWLAVIILLPRGLSAGRVRPAAREPIADAAGEPEARNASGSALPPLSLTLDGVARRFGSAEALAKTSIDVHAGEAVGVVGANGAGKTTLLEIASGAETPDEGRVLIGGRDVTLLGPASPSRAGIVHLVQDGSLFSTMSALDVVLLGAGATRQPGALGGLAGRGATEDEQLAAARALRDVGLEGLSHRRVDGLSTGERRRVALAAALAAKARLLLVDEPSAGVALADRPHLAQLLTRARRDSTLLLVDHDPEFVANVVDRTITLGDTAVDSPAIAPRAPAAIGPRDDVLVTRGLAVEYEGRRVLEATDLTLRRGELVLLLGPNGAGKTSLMRGLAGLADSTGSVELEGRDVSTWTPDRRARAGLCTLLADGPGFATLTVGAALQVAFRTHMYGRDADTDFRRDEMKTFPEIEEREGTRVRALSGGERQLLRVTQAVVAAPTVLLFDELSLGLAANARERAIDSLLTLRESGTALIVSDQDTALAGIADRVLHVDAGRVTEGTPA